VEQQVMHGLIQIQAVFLFIMMDTGLKLEQHQLDLQVHKVLPDQRVLEDLLVQQDPQVLQVQEVLEPLGG
jgi:hypothetical protein